MNKYKSLNFARLILYVFSCFFLSASLIPEDSAWAQPSPPQSEWVEIPQGNRIVHAYQVLPNEEKKAFAVLLIHENRGLTAWVQSVAERIAEAGYIAIAPDLLSGMGPNGGKTSDFPNEDAAITALNQLPAAQVVADLNAVADYIKAHDASNGKYAVAGFCWGGGQSFNIATRRSDLSASFVFYGSPPGNPNDMAQIQCPVFGFYGGNDARITATVPNTEAQMKAASKTYQPVIYEGAGHAFMRLGEDAGASAANRSAKDSAWDRWIEILNTMQSSVRWVNQ